MDMLFVNQVGEVGYLRVPKENPDLVSLLPVTFLVRHSSGQSEASEYSVTVIHLVAWVLCHPGCSISLDP